MSPAFLCCHSPQLTRLCAFSEKVTQSHQVNLCIPESLAEYSCQRLQETSLFPYRSALKYDSSLKNVIKDEWPICCMVYSQINKCQHILSYIPGLTSVCERGSVTDGSGRSCSGSEGVIPKAARAQSLKKMWAPPCSPPGYKVFQGHLFFPHPSYTNFQIQGPTRQRPPSLSRCTCRVPHASPGHSAHPAGGTELLSGQLQAPHHPGP